MCSSDIFLGLIAILFPPLAVWVKRGLCSADSLINILLCMLGFLPGLLHAWYIIAKFPDEEYSSNYERIPDAEGARVTYVVVQGGSGRSQRAPKNQSVQYQHYQPQQGYGSTAPMEAPAVQQQQNGTWAMGGEGQAQAGEGSSGAVPPSYAEAVKGDHKVQSRD